MASIKGNCLALTRKHELNCDRHIDFQTYIKLFFIYSVANGDSVVVVVVGRGDDSTLSNRLSLPSPLINPPTVALPAPSAPRAPQTRTSAALRKLPQSCSRDRTRPSPGPVVTADHSISVTRPSRPPRCTSPAGAGDPARLYAEPTQMN
jgi:hypothetical protein